MIVVNRFGRIASGKSDELLIHYKMRQNWFVRFLFFPSTFCCRKLARHTGRYSHRCTSMYRHRNSVLHSKAPRISSVTTQRNSRKLHTLLKYNAFLFRRIRLNSWRRSAVAAEAYVPYICTVWLMAILQFSSSSTIIVFVFFFFSTIICSHPTTDSSTGRQLKLDEQQKPYNVPAWMLHRNTPESSSTELTWEPVIRVFHVVGCYRFLVVSYNTISTI